MQIKRYLILPNPGVAETVYIWFQACFRNITKFDKLFVVDAYLTL